MEKAAAASDPPPPALGVEGSAPSTVRAKNAAVKNSRNFLGGIRGKRYSMLYMYPT
jgi:hypothetical protein